VLALLLSGCTAAGPGQPGGGTPPSRGSSATGSAPPSAAPTAGSVAWVAAENARPGTRGWRIPMDRGAVPGLDAYADRVSVLPGQRVGLAVSASGEVVARAFRMGWYRGVGARQVWSGRLVAHRRPAARTLDAALPDAGGIRDTRTAVAGWGTSIVVDTTSWPEGDYVFRLDCGRASRYVPLTVRSATAAGRELLVAGAMTWQAYNLWGGRSLYGDRAGSFAERSYAVSFDRPYGDGEGAGRFFEYDYPVVRQAERDGVPLAYATDYDVALHPALLDGAAAILLGGHLEYWTGPMRDAVVAAVHSGTNLAVLGANTAYWRVRLAGRAAPGDARAAGRRDGEPRIIVGTKDAALDPLARTDPAGATAKLRDPPDARREDALTGMQYDCFPANAPMTVADPRWWGFAGTGVRRGLQLPRVVGPESDRVYPVPGRPSPEEVVAYTRFACNGHPTAETSVYWTAPSGAGVFAAGTMRWPCAGSGTCLEFRPGRTQIIISRVTRNILVAFARPRAGRIHPAIDTVARFWLPARNTTHTV